MTERRVVVTGIGVITPLGNDPDTLWARLMAAESGVRALTTEGPRGRYATVAATAAFDAASFTATLSKSDNLDRVTLFSLAASALALADATLPLAGEDNPRCGVSWGTGLGASGTLEQSYDQVLRRDPERLKPLTVLTVMYNAAPAHIAIQRRLSGPNLTYSCACASSAVAIGEAARAIRHGYADAMLAGGAEAPLNYGAIKAWEALRVLAIPDRADPAASCRPFAKDRTGLVLGEGAAMVVLEERAAARHRGARIYAELAGYGSCNDPGHLAKPSVAGQARALALALADAGLTPHDIDYINAHGTGTVLNDVTETEAIKQVFGEHARHVPVSSTKSMHGHLLGGAGAVEFAIALLALQHRAIPPTAHLNVPDPLCDLDYVPGRGRRDLNIRAVMSNSFAFGGTNAVLIARALDR